jgi:hypothetical protein
VDEDRNTSLFMCNPINEIQKIEQEFIKSYQHHHLEILETRRLYTSTYLAMQWTRKMR